MPETKVVLDTSSLVMPLIRENSSDTWLREMW